MLAKTHRLFVGGFAVGVDENGFNGNGSRPRPIGMRRIHLSSPNL